MGNGTQLGDVAANMPDLPLEVVTIASGESAYARLQAVNIDPGGGPLGTDCGLGFGDGFNIYIPGAVEPTFVRIPAWPRAHPASSGWTSRRSARPSLPWASASIAP